VTGGRPGPIRAGSRTAAPASWRPRTRWPPSAWVRRTATAPSSATSSSAPTACPSCCTTRRWSAPPTAGHGRRPALGRAVAAGRRQLARPRLRRRAAAQLAAIARFVQRNGFALNIEIKPTPGHEQPPARPWRGVCGAVGRAACRRCSAPSAPRRCRARATAPELPRALLLDTLWDGWFDAARARLRGRGHQPPLMDAALIAQLHGAGLRALCYTVNDPPTRSACWRWASTASSPTRSTASHRPWPAGRRG
jgi:hypothetical protein